MLRRRMQHTRLFPAVFSAASLALSCGAGPTSRQTTANNARGDDPWLMGERCTRATPADPAPRIEVLAEGSGPPVAQGVTVRVHYVASLTNGVILHDSHDSHDGYSAPSEIILGSTKTICGFERALAGMRPGEQRRVLVPWSLAFGETGRPPEVPPRADLVFLVDLYLPADVVIERGLPPTNPSGMGRRR
jgi:hypothetical protein